MSENQNNNEIQSQNCGRKITKVLKTPILIALLLLGAGTSSAYTEQELAVLALLESQGALVPLFAEECARINLKEDATRDELLNLSSCCEQKLREIKREYGSLVKYVRKVGEKFDDDFASFTKSCRE